MMIGISLWQLAVPPDLELYESCKSWQLPWSVITSSQPNSSLAAVLAGFMITAIAFLLGRDKANNGTANTRETGKADRLTVPTPTLALFGSGVLVLGLDSYLFSTVYAIAPAVGSDRKVPPAATPACAIAWTQVMPASSMLAVGGAAMVGGLGWMLSQHLVTQNVRSRLIALLPGMLTFIVIVTTSLLLVRTTINYLDVLSANFQRPYPDWVEPVLWWFYKVYFVAILAMIAFRSFGIWTYVEEHPEGIPPGPAPAEVAHERGDAAPESTVGSDQSSAPGAHEPGPHGLSWKEILKTRFWSLFATSMLMAVLAFAGPVFASFVGEVGIDSHGIPTTPWVAGAIILCLLPCLVIFGPLAFSVPGADYRVYWKRTRPTAAKSN